MAATPQASTVTYQELADIEADFDDYDVELLRLQARRYRPLYERRAALLRRIPHFWPLVLEQAPPEIDQYIQPTDAALLMSALEDVEVARFEVEEAEEAAEAAEAAAGTAEQRKDAKDFPPDPRSIAVRLTFAPNDYFEDRVLEKRFWYRYAPVAAPRRRENGGHGDADEEDEDEDEEDDGWSGLVSEPVPIRWRRGKDLTGGLLDLAAKVWREQGEAEREAGEAKNGAKEEKQRGESPNQKALRAALGKTAVGGISFFAWFGYVGRRIGMAESRQAMLDERNRRTARRLGKTQQAELADGSGAEGEAAMNVQRREKEEDGKNGHEAKDAADGDDDSSSEEYPYEIFPDGDTLAVTLAEDLWPNAIKYFKQAQEQDEVSDADFESGSEEEEPSHPPPSKKQRT